MENKIKFGEELAKVLLLKKGENGNYITGYGSKSAEGLAELIQNMINEHNTINPAKPSSEEWKQMMSSISNNIGTAVEIPTKFGNYMIDHFTNCLPPIVWSDYHVLCSEPYSTDAVGNETYIGFFKKIDTYYGIICTITQFNSLR